MIGLSAGLLVGFGVLVVLLGVVGGADVGVSALQ